MRGALFLCLASIATPVIAAPDGPEPPIAPPRSANLLLSPRELLAFSDAALARGDAAAARAALVALTSNGDPAIRNEARFRLAMLHLRARQLTPAAVLLRAILDEQPEAQRVRLELAHVMDLMGDETGARKQLRAVQAGGLPPDVARLIDRYSAALRSRKPAGATIELAVAPDTNVNRATRSQTLGTVLGDFTLDQDARPRSGVGLALRGQAYVRHRLNPSVSLIARLSGSGDLYRDGQFSDIGLSVSAGPEIRLGQDRLAVEAGRLWRWYGGLPYSRNWTLGASYSHPLGRTSQLRANATVAAIANTRHPLLDGRSFSLATSYERALSARTGISASLALERQSLGDPAYSMTGGQLSLSGYRELGAFTLFGIATYGRQMADDRLALFPAKRSDRTVRLSLGATWRRLQLAGFSPLVRLTAERNRSTIEIYDYRRLRAEIGITRAF